jgi:outer membrane lipoprotein carrier protein
VGPVPAARAATRVARVPAASTRARNVSSIFRPTIVIAALLTIAPQRTGAVQNSAPSDLAARIQAHYLAVKDFSADFTLTQTTLLLPRGSTDRGELKVKKPLRMRWTYATSDKQQFISDGSELYVYQPADKYVEVRPLPKGGGSSTALLFLAGQADLTKDFNTTVPPEQPAGEWRLLLRPKVQADFSTLTLEVARTSFALRGLITVDDDQGSSSRFRFANLKENQGLSDREFLFAIPKGVEVIRH